MATRARPDTFQKFYADVEMYTNNFDGTDPEAYMASWACDKAPRPETQWQGENIHRFCDPAYDALVAELAAPRDLEERGELAKQMNDMLTKDTYTIIPLVDRGRRVGACQLAWRRGPERLGQRTVERRRLVPRQVIAVT